MIVPCPGPVVMGLPIGHVVDSEGSLNRKDTRSSCCSWLILILPSSRKEWPDRVLSLVGDDNKQCNGFGPGR